MAESPSIKIDIPTDGLRSVIHQYVLQQLSEEQRDNIMSQAVSFLLTPKRSSYGAYTASPLEDAFNQAVTQVMHEVAREMVRDNPEVKAKLHDLMGKAFIKWVTEDKYEYKRDSFVASMGEALGRAMAADD